MYNDLNYLLYISTASPQSIVDFSYDNDNMTDLFFQLMNDMNFEGVSVSINKSHHIFYLFPYELQLTILI